MSYELIILDDEPNDRWNTHEILSMRAKVAKEAEYLGPWCPTCGKKGKQCRNRQTCRTRAITSRKTSVYITLPKPPVEWMCSRGYGRMSTQYHAGGRWKEGGRAKFVSYVLNSEAKKRDMIQHYAYEVAMGRDAVEVAA